MDTLNVPEAAEFLKVHPKTVLDLIGNGDIPAAIYAQTALRTLIQSVDVSTAMTQ